MFKYPLQSFQVPAIYTSHGRAIYQGNPWIEALPNNPDDEDMMEALGGSIPYAESERELPGYERQSCVQSLTHVCIPIDQNLRIARKIYNSIREGYVNRNPLADRMKNIVMRMQEAVRNRDPSFQSMDGSNANACGFCIIGDSGLGKTTAFRRALNLFPQMIVHQEYQGMPFHNIQIVWMKLECPHDASVKGLCSEFFMKFDQLTGDNTYQKYASGGRATTDQMIPQMAMIAQRHGLGLLVIDEIQNLSKAKSGGAEKMLNFIVQLINTIGLPVLLVGIPEAVELLSKDLKAIRRSAGQQGMSYFHPLSADSDDWKNFTDGLWAYQWTAEKTELTEELRMALNKFSFGNIDATVKLYMEVQRIAIEKEEEGESGELTIDTLCEAFFSESFRLVLKRLGLEQKWEQEKKEAAKKKKEKRKEGMGKETDV